ncbi:MAG TPA: hypothetical protein VFP61_04300 [Acidimicrobiales bacterium]|nr:hypothetical protein [Acidimicrobiales bacterium]
MGHRTPSMREQLLFWPHRPPDPVKHAAATVLRHGTLPADHARARAALAVARRSQAALAALTVALAAAGCWAAAQVPGAADHSTSMAAGLLAAVAGWAAVRAGRVWRRQERRVARLARMVATPPQRGPVVVAASAPVGARAR